MSDGITYTSTHRLVFDFATPDNDSGRRFVDLLQETVRALLEASQERGVCRPTSKKETEDLNRQMIEAGGMDFHGGRGGTDAYFH